MDELLNKIELLSNDDILPELKGLDKEDYVFILEYLEQFK